MYSCDFDLAVSPFGRACWRVRCLAELATPLADPVVWRATCGCAAVLAARFAGPLFGWSTCRGDCIAPIPPVWLRSVVSRQGRSCVASLRDGFATLDPTPPNVQRLGIGVMQQDWTSHRMPLAVASPGSAWCRLGWEPALIRPASRVSSWVAPLGLGACSYSSGESRSVGSACRAGV